MFESETVVKPRCEGCEYRKIVHAQNNYTFYGCYHHPYIGKRVAEIKECPKTEIEKIQWLKWENLKECMEIECPMLGNERIMTYALENAPVYYSYTAPFVDEDGDVCYYQYDHDEGCWEDSIMCMGEYEEGTHYRMYGV